MKLPNFIDRYTQQLEKLHEGIIATNNPLAVTPCDPLVERILQGITVTSVQLDESLRGYIQQQYYGELRKQLCCPFNKMPGYAIAQFDEKSTIDIPAQQQFTHDKYIFTNPHSIATTSCVIEVMQTNETLQLTAQLSQRVDYIDLYLAGDFSIVLQLLDALLTTDTVTTTVSACINRLVTTSNAITFPKIKQLWLPCPSTAFLAVQRLLELAQYRDKWRFIRLPMLLPENIQFPCNVVWQWSDPTCWQTPYSCQWLSDVVPLINCFPHYAVSHVITPSMQELPLTHDLQNTAIYSVAALYTNDPKILPEWYYSELNDNESLSIKSATSFAVTPTLWLYHTPMSLPAQATLMLEQYSQSLTILRHAKAQPVAALPAARFYRRWLQNKYDAEQLVHFLSACYSGDHDIHEIITTFKSIETQREVIPEVNTLYLQLTINVILQHRQFPQPLLTIVSYILRELWQWHSPLSERVVVRLMTEEEYACCSK